MQGPMLPRRRRRQADAPNTEVGTAQSRPERALSIKTKLDRMSSIPAEGTQVNGREAQGTVTFIAVHNQPWPHSIEAYMRPLFEPLQTACQKYLVEVCTMEATNAQNNPVHMLTQMLLETLIAPCYLPGVGSGKFLCPAFSEFAVAAPFCLQMHSCICFLLSAAVQHWILADHQHYSSCESSFAFLSPRKMSYALPVTPFTMQGNCNDSQ